jgi:hypothetical protein
MLTSQQETVDLLASFGIQASDGAWNKLELPFYVLAVHDTITYNLTLLNNVMKEVNKVHNGSGVFTIRMAASYLIHSQHTLATSQAQFNAKTHTSVNMTYTWTVCNITLPLIDIRYISSKIFFAGLGVAEFSLEIFPGTKYQYYLSIYSCIEHIPRSIQLPLQVDHSFKLSDSGSSKQTVIFYHKNEIWGPPKYFKYSDLVKSMQQQGCATFKYHVVYAVNMTNVT